MDAQLDEFDPNNLIESSFINNYFKKILDFFLDPKPEVRQLASDHFKGFTSKESLKDEVINKFFKTRSERIVEQCINLFQLDWYLFPIAAHNAIIALTNLVIEPSIASEFSNHPKFLPLVVNVTTLPTSALADPICMLLSNMTKHESLAVSLLKQENALEDLADVFVKGSEKTFNKQADYNFLASVFANLSMFPIARVYFLEPSKRDNLLPITRLMVFTEHPSIIRRGGVISAIKNICFDSKYHHVLLEEGGVSDILPYLLLPLCGPEPFDEDDMEGMPEDIQLLPEDKVRESDPKLRQMIVESLLMLTTTRRGREILRARKVYPVLRELHKFETAQPVSDCIDELVQMLMRDELPESDSVTIQQEDEGTTIEEIV